MRRLIGEMRACMEDAVRSKRGGGDSSGSSKEEGTERRGHLFLEGMGPKFCRL